MTMIGSDVIRLDMASTHLGHRLAQTPGRDRWKCTFCDWYIARSPGGTLTGPAIEHPCPKKGIEQ